MSKKKNVAWGIVLILLAVYLIVSRLDLIPTIPFFTVVFTLVFGYFTIHGLMKHRITQTIMSLAILGCIYDKYIGIEAITPWPLLIAALLVSIGLEMIFKNSKKHSDYTYFVGGDHVTDFVDGEYVRCENNFGSTGKYVNSDHFTGAKLENNFGSMNVYFDNAVMANATADVTVENNFGESNLYFPKTWKLNLTESTAFGEVKVRTQGSQDPDAPTVRLHAEANFGSINVYFN